jgi:hypothetical protein
VTDTTFGVAIVSVVLTVLVFLMAFLMLRDRGTPEIGGCVIRQVERYNDKGGTENVNYIVCPLPTEYQK